MIYLAFALVTFCFVAHVFLVDKQYQRTRRELRLLKEQVAAGKDVSKVVPGAGIPIVASAAVPPNTAYLVTDRFFTPSVEDPFAVFKNLGGQA